MNRIIMYLLAGGIMVIALAGIVSANVGCPFGELTGTDGTAFLFEEACGTFETVSFGRETLASEFPSSKNEARQIHGNEELIVNETGHYVIIRDPFTGTVQLVNLTLVKESRVDPVPEESIRQFQTAQDMCSPREQTPWYPETSQTAEATIQVVPISLASTLNITSPGIYTLTSDYLGSDQVAIDIQCSDVTILGNGHSITGVNPPSFSTGIQISGSKVTISDVVVSGWDYGISNVFPTYPIDCVVNKSVMFNNDFYGIDASDWSSSVIDGNTFYNNGFHGIELSSSDNNIVCNNLFYSEWMAIGILSSDNNEIFSNYIFANREGVETDDSLNSIFNNFFVNEKNFNVWTSSSGENILNADPPFSGYTNIIGGSLIGGNFWGYPNNTGFSQVNPDTDNNGLCDVPYNLDSNNRDKYPLAPGKTSTTLSLSAPSTATCGIDYDLNGRLTRGDGSGIGGMLIFINMRYHDTQWTVTDSNGYYHFTWNAELGTSEINATFPGWSTFTPSSSPLRTVNGVTQGKPILITVNGPDSIHLGQEFLVSGSVTSAGTGIPVYLIPEYSWDNVNWFRVFPATSFRSDSSGHYEWKETVTTSSSSYLNLRVRHVADCYYANGTGLKTIAILENWPSPGGHTLSSVAMDAKSSTGVWFAVIRGMDNHLYFNKFTQSTNSWAGWTSIGGTTYDEPAVAYTGNNCVHVVIRGVDNVLYSKKLNLTTNTWDAGWTLLGGHTSSAPTLLSWSGSQIPGDPAVLPDLWLAIRGTDNHLYLKRWTPASGWESSWQSWGGTTYDRPALAFWFNTTTGNGILTLGVRGADNKVYTKDYSFASGGSGSMGTWKSPGGSTLTPPVIRCKDGLLQVVVRGTDNRLYYKKGSNPYISLGGTTHDMPAVFIRPNQPIVDVSVRGTDARIYNKILNLDTNQQSGWTYMKQSATGHPTFSRGTGSDPVLAVRGIDNQVYVLGF